VQAIEIKGIASGRSWFWRYLLHLLQWWQGTANPHFKGLPLCSPVHCMITVPLTDRA
jgi:hypothetical protein